MAYHVKELFFSLQGEGANTGCAAVFCRFAGCNLWSGREQDREDADCDFCDTDFVGGEKYASAGKLAKEILKLWPPKAEYRFVILTGGEPGLQVDAELIEALQERDFTVAIESNGTVDLPGDIDWISISPKGKAALKVTSGNELKLVYPQDDHDPADFKNLEFGHFYIQPKAGPDEAENVRRAMDYCRQHPQWRLSLQTHKLLNIR